jgi:hypothetical protein
MLRFAKTDVARGLVPDAAAVHKDEDTYDCHAGNLYRQALFTLDDAEMAAQVVSDVIVEECVRPAAVPGFQDARGRLAASAYRRCMELAGSPAWTARRPAGRAGSFADSVGPGGLNARERGALGLVLFSGPGYRHVAVDLGVPASDMTPMLRAALAKAAASEPGPLPYASQERAWP